MACLRRENRVENPRKYPYQPRKTRLRPPRRDAPRRHLPSDVGGCQARPSHGHSPPHPRRHSGFRTLEWRRRPAIGSHAIRLCRSYQRAAESDPNRSRRTCVCPGRQADRHVLTFSRLRVPSSRSKGHAGGRLDRALSRISHRDPRESPRRGAPEPCTRFDLLRHRPLQYGCESRLP